MDVVKVLEPQKCKIIPFPNVNSVKRELDLTFVNIAQERTKLITRENEARNYSANCKRNLINKDDVMCVISGLSVFATIAILYFIGIIL